MPQKPREHELFVSERPVTSRSGRPDSGRPDFGRIDLARERAYARRRMATVTVLALIVGTALYVGWQRHGSDPTAIPTVKAEGIYKQKPTDPGGIAIPHQDVQIYNEIDSKTAPAPGIEHLLPPPEAPQDVPHAAIAEMPAPTPPAPSLAASLPPLSIETPQPSSIAARQPTPTLTPAPPAHAKPDAILNPTLSKSIATTVMPIPPAPAAAPIALVTPDPSPPPTPSAPTPPQTIDDVLKNTQLLTTPPQAAITTATTTGATAIQLASVPDPSQAQTLLKNLQQKYASELNGVVLHLQSVDLGARGVYYRIQSSPLNDEAATHLCAALKQKNAGCILVRL